MAKSKTSGRTNREAQREQLRKQREAELKRQRNIRNFMIAIVSVVALVIVAGAGYLIYNALKPEPELPQVAPQTVSTDKPYLTVGAEPGSGKPEVDLVIDFMCPFCGQFEQVNSSDITSIIKNKDATVNFYVRSFLSDRASTTSYSARAAGAALAVYEESPENFATFQSLLFQNQPEEGGPGLSDAELAGYAEDAGASATVVRQINDHTYQRWAVDNLEPAGAKISPSTPAVRINGTMWGENGEWQTPGAFAQAVKSAGPAPGAAASDGGQ